MKGKYMHLRFLRKRKRELEDNEKAHINLLYFLYAIRFF